MPSGPIVGRSSHLVADDRTNKARQSTLWLCFLPCGLWELYFGVLSNVQQKYRKLGRRQAPVFLLQRATVNERMMRRGEGCGPGAARWWPMHPHNRNLATRHLYLALPLYHHLCVFFFCSNSTPLRGSPLPWPFLLGFGPQKVLQPPLGRALCYPPRGWAPLLPHRRQHTPPLSPYKQFSSRTWSFGSRLL